MTVSRKALCITYGLIEVVAFLGAWANGLVIVKQHGFVGGTIYFWPETLLNESSRFVTVDILFLWLAALVWMVLEARRLVIPGLWLYIAFGSLLGFSLALPLFLIHRERRLAVLEPDSLAGQPHTVDVMAIIVLGVVFTGYAVVALPK
jgi:hypothetical protein